MYDMKMKLNIIGKLMYLHEIVWNYTDWYKLLINRLLHNVTTILRMRNGIFILGGNRSLIVDLASEIFIHEVYNPKEMKINPGDLVIDIGANIGVFGLYASKNLASMVYEIEPLVENIPIIKSNFEKNNFKNLKILNVAVSDKDGSDKLFTADLDSHGLLFDHNVQGGLTKFKIVKTMTLETIIKKNKINHINFLKMDCEGSEGNIFKSTKSKTWKMIDKVAIEYHDNVSVLNHQNIVSKLTSNGYKTRIVENDNFFGYIYAWRN